MESRKREGEVLRELEWNKKGKRAKTFVKVNGARKVRAHNGKIAVADRIANVNTL